MKPIFTNAPSLGIRLFFAIFLSIILILLDGRSSAMVQIRNILENAVSGLYYFSNSPKVALDGVSNGFISSQKLQLENQALKQQLLEKNSDLQLLDQLKVENNRLRLLLGSPLRQDEYKKIVEVLAAEMDTYRQQVIINQGQQDGVFLGQPVIDERGIIGQVISVSENTSRVLLLTDVTHAIPVQVLRNDVRAIANGMGRSDELILENMVRGIDIAVGDVLVSSGLGGRFPEGYPVAVVETVQNDGSSHFARATARPLASLDRLRYLLLLWPLGQEQHKALSPKDVREVVNERRKSLSQIINSDKKEKINPDSPSESQEHNDIFENPNLNNSDEEHSTDEGAE